MAGLLIAAICFLLATTSDRSIFRRHVIDKPDAISNLQAGSASCMHCPMYFRFEASPPLLSRLIALHEMEPVDRMPEFMAQTVSLFREPWWVGDAELARSQKYWVMYEGTRGGEPRVRLALVDGTTIYFATSGHFEKGDSRKLPLPGKP